MKSSLPSTSRSPASRSPSGGCRTGAARRRCRPARGCGRSLRPGLRSRGTSWRGEEEAEQLALAVTRTLFADDHAHFGKRFAASLVRHEPAATLLRSVTAITSRPTRLCATQHRSRREDAVRRVVRVVVAIDADERRGAVSVMASVSATPVASEVGVRKKAEEKNFWGEAPRTDPGGVGGRKEGGEPPAAQGQPAPVMMRGKS